MNQEPLMPEQSPEAEAENGLILQEIEAPEEKKKGGFLSAAFDVLEMFAWSVFVVMLLFTFVVRLCRVEGQSMENTLYGNETLLLYSLGYTPKQNDIIVFHLTNPDASLEKTLVKRVIATEGQEVEIRVNEREIYIDGVRFADSNAVFKSPSFPNDILYNYNYDKDTGIFSATVPEGCIFVMGDNRNHSNDSRNVDIGFVDTRCVLGKVVFRLSPFTVFTNDLTDG